MNFKFSVIFVFCIINLSNGQQDSPIKPTRLIDTVRYNRSETSKMSPQDLFNLHHAFVLQNMTWEFGQLIYEIDDDFDVSERQKIFVAMDEIKRRTCIRFIPYDNNTHQHYVKIQKDFERKNIAEAIVGCDYNGKQDMFFGSNRLYEYGYHYIILHEILHALGFRHHHQRSNRDRFIEFDMNHTDVSDFDIIRNYIKEVDPDPEVELITHFDLASVMMYDATINSMNGDFMISKREGYAIPDRLSKNHLSLDDVFLINEFCCRHLKKFDKEIEREHARKDNRTKLIDDVRFDRNQTSTLSSVDRRNLHHAFTLQIFKWKDGQVNYEVDDTFDAIERKRINKAMDEIEEATCIRFVPFDNKTHQHFVRIHKYLDWKHRATTDIGCHYQGEQEMWFGYGWLYKYGYHYTILHEFLHTLGFRHHHMRSDRDKSIEFHLKNTNLSNFEITTEFVKELERDPEVQFLTDFDFDSVMLYDPYYLSANGRPFITSKLDDKEITRHYDKRRLSESDKFLINKFYKCPHTEENETISSPIRLIDSVRYSRNLTSEMTPEDVRNLHHAFSFQILKWKDGQVNYEVDDQFDVKEKEVIYSAMEEIQKSTCVRFVRHNNKTRQHFVRIHKDMKWRDKIEAAVGCQHQGRQYMWLGYGWIDKKDFRYIIFHQLLHLIGFNDHHERSDRDTYIEFHLENTNLSDFDITSRMVKEFEPDPKMQFITKFDFYSVMLYDPYFLSANGLPVITSKQNGTQIPRSYMRQTLSKSDKVLINKLYDCPEPKKEERGIFDWLTDIF